MINTLVLRIACIVGVATLALAAIDMAKGL
jgi:hypothetical protein